VGFGGVRSEEIHGISKAALQADGVPAVEAIARLETALAGLSVVSDVTEWGGVLAPSAIRDCEPPLPYQTTALRRAVKEVAPANGIDPEVVTQRIEDWALVTSEAAVHRAGPMPPTIAGRQ
jgi:hypothetical protein